MIGNACADVLAERGAILGEPTLQERVDVLWFHSQVRRIQMRLALVVQKAVLQKRGVVEQAVSQRRLILPMGWALLRTKHTAQQSRCWLWCLTCGVRVSKTNHKAVVQWLYSACSDLVPRAHLVVRLGVASHVTHAISYHRGVWFCKLCGRYAIQKVVSLQHPCPKVPLMSGVRLLDRIQKDKLPWGIYRWPDDGGGGGISRNDDPTGPSLSL